jgi:excinuclease ABC subunit A
MDQIIIRGARQHNLKNIDLVLPRNRFIVITGVSGSGKSSLAFDTLFAEGQRRYLEALSTYARQFLTRMDAPQVDEIRGLSPAIAIEQKGAARNPRSTVGTLTETYDHLRLLYARLGTLYCPACSVPVRAYSIPQMILELLRNWHDGARMLILAPLKAIKEKELPALLKQLRRNGFARIRFEGQVHELDPLPHLPRRPSYKLDVIVDRLMLDRKKAARLHDSLELASKTSKGIVGVAQPRGEEKVFSEMFRCVSCDRVFPELTPGLFSFHHPTGACPTCNGLGALRPEKADWTDFKRIASMLPTDSAALPDICPECGGSRLNELARSVRLGDRSINEVLDFQFPGVEKWLGELELSPTEERIASRPRQEIGNRLKTMDQLGLSYLSLSRSANTLSGGELQRVRLAHQVGSPLSGVLYVLDEPSIGLHPRDHERLLNILLGLRDAGNTVIVVEHDRDTILRADHVVDMGPGAGAQGGEVIFSGPPDELKNHPQSLTAQYLSGQKAITSRGGRPPFTSGTLVVAGARGHNLKNITVRFPLGCMTCVTGVSGAGKSTLVVHTLHRALAQRLFDAKARPSSFDFLEGAEKIHKVIMVDQTPLGRTPRSIPATYMGLFSLIRQLFSQIPEARARGYGPNRFSFNVKGGRCETCKGEGLQTIEMFFLPDVYVTCPMCEGTRYSGETLDVRFKGRSIADVLAMTVHEAVVFFENVQAIRHKLEALQEVGLGYLRIGQPATTLSGGEAQRVKLAAELSRKTAEHTLYILEEPTTGLHFDDIQKLLHVLQRLVDLGHTVIMIEHHPDVVRTADYIIDLGPEGGEGGGKVVAAGTPDEVARTDGSFTGGYLREILKMDGDAKRDQTPKDR